MINIIRYSNCPVCGSAAIKNIFTVKDYTVSGQTFPIVECNSCTLRFTQDVPAMDSIAPYYKAEDYISHTDTSRGFINRMYKAVRKRTLVKKRKLVARFTGMNNGSVLDVGSGTGSFANEMKQHGWEVTGLEPDEDARKVAHASHRIQLKDISALYELKPGSFDAITLWHVLEHVHELPAYVQQLKNLLTAKGKLFIAVPNYTSYDAVVYKEYWAAYDVPRHLYHFSPSAMKTLMEKNGLRMIRYKPMWYDSFYISLLSSKYKNGKPALISAVWTGLRSNLVALGDVKRCSSLIYVVEK